MASQSEIKQPEQPSVKLTLDAVERHAIAAALTLAITQQTRSLNKEVGTPMAGVRRQHIEFLAKLKDKVDTQPF